MSASVSHITRSRRPRPAGAAHDVEAVIARERSIVQLLERLDVRPSFEQLLELYAASGFMHPGRQRLVDARAAAVEATWRTLLEAEGVLSRVVVRHGVRDGGPVLLNSASAFAYAPGTWQIQHLVSATRGERVGTLVVVAALLDWLHEAGVGHVRAAFRPDNRGVAPLLLSLQHLLGDALICFPVVDYGCVPVDAVRLPRVPGDVEVVRIRAGQAAGVANFYSRLLHPVELESLRLDDVENEATDAVYAEYGLRRRRSVLAAVAGGQIAGACIVNHASEGVNLSFWENAIEHLRVDPELAPWEYEAVWSGLARAAVCEVARDRDYVVSALHPADFPLAHRAGLLSADPEQYVVMSGALDKDVYIRVVDHMADYHSSLLGAEAAA